MSCVLIVEDDDDVCTFMEILLKANGYETMCAHNGREALEKMRERQPSVVLLDLHMPVMDGWEFRRQQLHDPRQASVPVIAVTAHYDPRDVEQRLGIKCLHKPLSIDHIISEVEHACEAPAPAEMGPQGQRRDGPEKQRDVFRLRKGSLTAECQLWSHPSGWELRVYAGGEFLQSLVCRSADEALSGSENWKAMMHGKGWR